MSLFSQIGIQEFSMSVEQMIEEIGYEVGHCRECNDISFLLSLVKRYRKDLKRVEVTQDNSIGEDGLYHTQRIARASLFYVPGGK